MTTIRPCNICKKNDVCKILQHLNKTPTTWDGNFNTPPDITLTYCRNKDLHKCNACGNDATHLEHRERKYYYCDACNK